MKRISVSPWFLDGNNGTITPGKKSHKSALDAPDKALRFHTCVGTRPERYGGHRLQLRGVYLDVPTLKGGYTVGFRGRGDGVGGGLPGAGSG